MSKIQTRGILLMHLELLRKAQPKFSVVFTNGCFDVLHVGHVNLLRRAKILGQLLIVGVNSDSSVQRNKGAGRPIVPQDERAEILSALEMVDFVTIFEEPTPIQLITAIKPAVLVKGADWDKHIVGKEYVEGYGGSVVSLPFERMTSTSQILEKVLKKGP